MTVYRGSDVIMKGFMNGTLYLLKGITVTGSANVASLEIPEEHITKLWHICKKKNSYVATENLQRPFSLIISYDYCNNEYLLQFHYKFIAK